MPPISEEFSCRAHARGERIPAITVQPGATVEEVRECEGYTEDEPVIAHSWPVA